MMTADGESSSESAILLIIFHNAIILFAFSLTIPDMMHLTAIATYSGGNSTIHFLNMISTRKLRHQRGSQYRQ